MGLDEERSRIIEWGLEAMVERLLEAGNQSPQAIAHKMMADPDVLGIVGASVVRQHDIKVYMAHRNSRKETALAKSLVHTPDGRALIEAARANVAWIVEQVELLKPILPTIKEDMETELERWRSNKAPRFDESGNQVGMNYPMAQLAAMEKVLRLVKDIGDSVKGDERMQQLIRAGSVNISQGISQQEMFDIGTGCFEHLQCPSCGYKSFGRDDFGRTFARYRSRKAIDAEPINGGH